MINKAVAQYDKARDNLYEAMKAGYPKGRRVEFMRSSRQKTPSHGTVSGYYVDAHGYLSILPANTKRGQNCFISMTDIITLPVCDQDKEKEQG